MDSNGFIFTIDALLSLLIITVLMGISADAMDIAGNRITDFSSEQSYERVALDVADILIKTSGSPDNWERIGSLTHVTPGLRDNNDTHSENKLSIAKINYLRSHPQLLDRMIPEGLKCSLMIYPVDTSLPAITVINRTPENEESDVYVVNRTISFELDLYKIYSFIKMDQLNEENNSTVYVCPHSTLGSNAHHSPDFRKAQPGWICTPFKINIEDMNSKDFYLVTDPPVINDKNAQWLINKPDNTTGIPQKFVKTSLNVNNRIREIWDENGMMVLHVSTSGESENMFNVYLVGVPSGTPVNYVKLDNIGIKPAYFILKIWN